MSHMKDAAIMLKLDSCNIYTCKKRAETIVNETHIHMYNIMDCRKGTGKKLEYWYA